MLIFKLLPKCIDFGFNKSQDNISFLYKLMILFLWISWDENIRLIDASQCVEPMM